MSLFLKNLPKSFFRAVVSSRPIFNKSTSLFASISHNHKPPQYPVLRKHARTLAFGSKNIRLYGKKAKKPSSETGPVTCTQASGVVECKIDCEAFGASKPETSDCEAKVEEKKTVPTPKPKKPIPKYKKEVKECERPDVKAVTGTWVSKKCHKFDFSCGSKCNVVNRDETRPIRLEDSGLKASKLFEACKEASSKGKSPASGAIKPCKNIKVKAKKTKKKGTKKTKCKKAEDTKPKDKSCKPCTTKSKPPAEEVVYKEVCNKEELAKAANSSLVVTISGTKSEQKIVKKEPKAVKPVKSGCMESPNLNQKLPETKLPDKDIVTCSKNLLKSVCDGLKVSKSKSTPNVKKKKGKDVKKSKSLEETPAAKKKNVQYQKNPKRSPASKATEINPCKASKPDKAKEVASASSVKINPCKSMADAVKVIDACKTAPKKPSITKVDACKSKQPKRPCTPLKSAAKASKSRVMKTEEPPCKPCMEYQIKASSSVKKTKSSCKPCSASSSKKVKVFDASNPVRSDKPIEPCKNLKKSSSKVDNSPIMQCIEFCRKMKLADTPQKGKGIPPRDRKPCLESREEYKKVVGYDDRPKQGGCKEEAVDNPCQRTIDLRKVTHDFVPAKQEKILSGIRKTRSEKEGCLFVPACFEKLRPSIVQKSDCDDTPKKVIKPCKSSEKSDDPEARIKKTIDPCLSNRKYSTYKAHINPCPDSRKESQDVPKELIDPEVAKLILKTASNTSLIIGTYPTKQKSLYDISKEILETLKDLQKELHQGRSVFPRLDSKLPQVPVQKKDFVGGGLDLLENICKALCPKKRSKSVNYVKKSNTEVSKKGSESVCKTTDKAKVVKKSDSCKAPKKSRSQVIKPTKAKEVSMKASESVCKMTDKAKVVKKSESSKAPKKCKSEVIKTTKAKESKKVEKKSKSSSLDSLKKDQKSSSIFSLFSSKKASKKTKPPTQKPSSTAASKEPEKRVEDKVPPKKDRKKSTPYKRPQPPCKYLPVQSLGSLVTCKKPAKKVPSKPKECIEPMEHIVTCNQSECTHQKEIEPCKTVEKPKVCESKPKPIEPCKAEKKPKICAEVKPSQCKTVTPKDVEERLKKCDQKPDQSPIKQCIESCQKNKVKDLVSFYEKEKLINPCPNLPERKSQLVGTLPKLEMIQPCKEVKRSDSDKNLKVPDIQINPCPNLPESSKATVKAPVIQINPCPNLPESRKATVKAPVLQINPRPNLPESRKAPVIQIDPCLNLPKSDKCKEDTVIEINPCPDVRKDRIKIQINPCASLLEPKKSKKKLLEPIGEAKVCPIKPSKETLPVIPPSLSKSKRKFVCSDDGPQDELKKCEEIRAKKKDITFTICGKKCPKLPNPCPDFKLIDPCAKLRAECKAKGVKSEDTLKPIDPCRKKSTDLIREKIPNVDPCRSMKGKKKAKGSKSEDSLKPIDPCKKYAKADLVDRKIPNVDPCKSMKDCKKMVKATESEDNLKSIDPCRKNSKTALCDKKMPNVEPCGKVLIDPCRSLKASSGLIDPCRK